MHIVLGGVDMSLCIIHKWQGCKCVKCGKQRDEGHDWEGCRCKNCGKIKHVYEVVNIEHIFGDGCKWDITRECTGPGCGTWCDSYYEGRESRTIKTFKCKYCGEIKTEA